jgi:hypothetical protein
MPNILEYVANATITLQGLGLASQLRSGYNGKAKRKTIWTIHQRFSFVGGQAA